MNERGLQIARRWAQWHLGDAKWAELIVGVYLNPEAAEQNLREEMRDSKGARS